MFPQDWSSNRRASIPCEPSASAQVVLTSSALWGKYQSVPFNLLQACPWHQFLLTPRYWPDMPPLPLVYRAVCLLTHLCFFVLKRNVIYYMGEEIMIFECVFTVISSFFLFFFFVLITDSFFCVSLRSVIVFVQKLDDPRSLLPGGPSQFLWHRK